jgi:hypothetical protein
VGNAARLEEGRCAAIHTCRRHAPDARLPEHCEFSNGIDITYYWSAGLAPGTGYWCPLPTWAKREYHVAARSGTTELGRWIDEDKDLYADYASHVGEPPERVRRVWLIANSMFQRGRGECSYRAIRLRSHEGAETRVL